MFEGSAGSKLYGAQGKCQTAKILKYYPPRDTVRLRQSLESLFLQKEPEHMTRWTEKPSSVLENEGIWRNPHMCDSSIGETRCGGETPPSRDRNSSMGRVHCTAVCWCFLITQVHFQDPESCPTSAPHLYYGIHWGKGAREEQIVAQHALRAVTDWLVVQYHISNRRDLIKSC